jgi:hypothetical protein
MQVNKITQIAFGLLASVSLFSSTVAIASSRYEEEIPNQLMFAARALGFGDYQLFAGPYIDRLDANGEARLTFTLRKGATYAIIGVCDEDCSDIDMEIYDQNGNSIAVDRGTDDYPMLQISPAWTAEFTLEVDMYNCSTSYCYYGVGVYRP